MATIPDEVVKAAQSSHAAFYPRGPFASITIAQWIDESDWGKYTSGKNNFFGIKATVEQINAGEATARRTHETIRGDYRAEIQWFADYPSLEDGFKAHARLLAESSYYWQARQAISSDEYATALTGIYATGIPGHPYGEVLIEIMRENDLYRYDVRPIS